MTLFGFALLADENTNPLVVTGLRALGCDVKGSSASVAASATVTVRPG